MSLDLPEHAHPDTKREVEQLLTVIQKHCLFYFRVYFTKAILYLYVNNRISTCPVLITICWKVLVILPDIWPFEARWKQLKSHFHKTSGRLEGAQRVLTEVIGSGGTDKPKWRQNCSTSAFLLVSPWLWHLKGLTITSTNYNKQDQNRKTSDKGNSWTVYSEFCIIANRAIGLWYFWHTECYPLKVIVLLS